MLLLEAIRTVKLEFGIKEIGRIRSWTWKSINTIFAISKRTM